MITFGNKPDPVLLALGALAVVLLLWWSLRSARGATGRGRRWILLGLRLMVLAVIAFILLDPQWMKEIQTFRPGNVAVLLDTSRSMGVEENGQTRLDTARQWLQERLQLPAGFSSQSFGFADTLQELTDWRQATNGGPHTALYSALAELADASTAEPPASVLIVTDGADTGSVRGRDVGARLARMKIAVNGLLIGSTNEPPDVVVEQVESRLVTDKRTTVQVNATIAAPGFGGQTARVVIRHDGQQVLAREVALTGEAQSVKLDFAPYRNGFQVFTLAVEPLPGERLVTNNQRDFGLTVTDPTLRVLYMEATAINMEQPEIFFLKHALEDEPGIEVRALFFDQHGAASSGQREQIAYVDPRNGDRVYRVQHSRYGYPKTLDELLRYHVVICSDVARTAFTPQQMENTVRFVEEFGGGFVMVGGETSFGSGFYDQTPIEKIIPVEMQGSRDANDTSFQLRPSAEALQHPVLKMADDPAANQATWAKLPMFYGFNRVDRAKPGATVLWEHPTERNQYGQRVILAVQAIGKGRSMAFTTDTTAAWGRDFERLWGEPVGPGPARSALNNDARYYKQFWVNAVRWLAAYRFEKEQLPIKLELADAICRPGHEAAFTASVELLDGKPVAGLKARAELFAGQRLVQTAALLWDDSAQAWRGGVTPDAEGRFELRFTVEDGEGKASTAVHLLDARERDVELAEVRARPEPLAALVQETGGTLLRADSTPEEVATALAGLNVISTKFEKEPLWDTWVWLALIIGLLTVEWVVRRTGGLA